MSLNSKIKNSKILTTTIVFVVLALIVSVYFISKNKASADSFMPGCSQSSTSCGKLVMTVKGPDNKPIYGALVTINLTATKTMQNVTNSSGMLTMWFSAGNSYQIQIAPSANDRSRTQTFNTKPTASNWPTNQTFTLQYAATSPTPTVSTTRTTAITRTVITTSTPTNGKGTIEGVVKEFRTDGAFIGFANAAYVYLYSNNGSLLDLQQTSSNGSYKFRNVSIGSGVVQAKVFPRDGFGCSSSLNNPIPVVAGRVSNANISLSCAVSGSLTLQGTVTKITPNGTFPASSGNIARKENSGWQNYLSINGDGTFFMGWPFDSSLPAPTSHEYRAQDVPGCSTSTSQSGTLSMSSPLRLNFTVNCSQ